MRSLRSTLLLSISLVTQLTGCVTCPDEELRECGPNARLVLEDSGLLCPSSRCEPINECEDGLLYDEECPSGTEAIMYPDEGGCLVTYCEPILPPVHECPPVEPQACGPEERSILKIDEDGCEQLTCESTVYDPICTSFELPVCAHDEVLVWRLAEDGCDFAECAAPELSCPELTPPLCGEGEELHWVFAEDGCDYPECVAEETYGPLSPLDPSVEATVTWSAVHHQQNILLSEDLLQVTVEEDSVNDTILANAMTSSGKWYWEVSLLSHAERSYNSVGVCGLGQSLELSPSFSGGVGYEQGGRIFYEGYQLFNHGPRYGIGDTVGVILDAGLKRVWFIVNGQLIGGGDPALGAGGIPLAEDGELWGPCLNLSRGYVYQANFGQAPWIYGQPQSFEPPRVE